MGDSRYITTALEDYYEAAKTEDIQEGSNYPSRDIQVGGDHYKNMAIQPTEFIIANNLGFCEGNVVKYVCRHKFKNGKEDLEKAIHYLQMLIEQYYPPKPPAPPLNRVANSPVNGDYIVNKDKNPVSRR